MTIERLIKTLKPTTLNKVKESIRMDFDKLIKEEWAGRKFRCKDTGAEFTIPNDVYETAFYQFGNCFIDVGRYDCYSRWGGNVEEIERD